MIHFLLQSASLVPWWGGVISIFIALLGLSCIPLAYFEMRQDRIVRRRLRAVQKNVPKETPVKQPHTWHDNYDLW